MPPLQIYLNNLRRRRMVASQPTGESDTQSRTHLSATSLRLAESVASKSDNLDQYDTR